MKLKNIFRQFEIENKENNFKKVKESCSQIASR